MLSCGLTKIYDLIKAGELESFVDGGSRKITTESIYRYIANKATSGDKSPARSNAASVAVEARKRADARKVEA